MSTPRVYWELERRIAAAKTVAVAGREDCAGTQADAQRFDLIADILEGRRPKGHHVLEAARQDGRLLDECRLCGLNFRDEVHLRAVE